MGKDYSICVGAVGFGGGVWHSPDGGESWNRIRDPFPLGSAVRGLAVYPDDPHESWPAPTTASIAVKIRGPHGKSCGRLWMVCQSGQYP